MAEETGFKGFSCLSTLYAQHAWLMHRIAETFSGEIALFLDDVRDRTAHLLLPRRLQESISADGCRHWWIGSVHDCGRRRIYLRVDPRRPEIVWPGELHGEIRCAPAWRDADDSTSCRCATALCTTQPSSTALCVIRYDENNPVDTAACRLAMLLTDCQPLITNPSGC